MLVVPAGVTAERARAGLEAERRQVGVLQTEQAQQQAALSEAKAALELAQAFQRERLPALLRLGVFLGRFQSRSSGHGNDA